MRPEAARRAVDVMIAALALAILSPLLAAIAAAIGIMDGRPLLFRQERWGQRCRPFPLVKFRSMRPAAPGEAEPGVTAAGDPRVTRLGCWLRRSKLDELPQLWNVLRGDMSLIGSRPELPRYAALYRDEYAKLLAVRPGLLDPATLLFAREEELLPPGPECERVYLAEILPRKIALSRAYLDRRTWRSDLRLAAATLGAWPGRSRRLGHSCYGQPAPRSEH